MDSPQVLIRYAAPPDAEALAKFFDDELAGRKKNKKTIGSGDFFVPRQRCCDFVRNRPCWLAISDGKIIGVAVKNLKSNVLIHLLVAWDWRGKGIGARLLNTINPDVIRSKTDQQAGNPKTFYEKMGYRSSGIMTGRKGNIEMMTRGFPARDAKGQGGPDTGSAPVEAPDPEAPSRTDQKTTAKIPPKDPT